MIDTFGWGFVDLAVTELAYLDLVFKQSDVPLSAGIAELGFMDAASGADSSSLLEQAVRQEGSFSGLGSRREALGVDIVSLNLQGPHSPDHLHHSDHTANMPCGYAPLQDPSREVSLRAHLNTCHNDLTLAHETGHNLGLAHGVHGSKTDASPGLPVARARGFAIYEDIWKNYRSSRFQHTEFGSLMSYGGIAQPRLSDANAVYWRTHRYSGPFLGIPPDLEDGNPGADSAGALRRYGRGSATRARPGQRLVSSVLPGSRFVKTGEPAAAFITVINPGQTDGVNCRIQHHGPWRDKFIFQTTDAANTPVGEINQPINIPAGGKQTFIISLTPEEPIPKPVPPSFTGRRHFQQVRFTPHASCDNLPMAEVTYGVNTINLGAEEADAPRLLAVAVTAGRNGIVDMTPEGTGSFAVGTYNLGGAGRVTASARSLTAQLSVTGKICQTDPAGACLAPPADSVTLDTEPGASATFAVHLTERWAIPFDAHLRFQFEMRLADDEVGPDSDEPDGHLRAEKSARLRASTSVAVRSLGNPVPEVHDSYRIVYTHIYAADIVDPLPGRISGYHDRYEIIRQPETGIIEIDPATGRYRYIYTESRDAPSPRHPYPYIDDSFTWRAGNSAGWSEPATVYLSLDDEEPFPVHDDILTYDPEFCRYEGDLQ